ncbi:cytochrome c oxidase assembly factor Coa1 family protein [Pseudoxanthomonas daejeonensis]|uniref:Cytochrome oxidase complex assembly protein 1 n=1 Tax=Pseudoxanthomonas daejeonensis TaxID=266062 RepID=A0ABQ6Z7C8_9GAMM|nr:cytochrome c oxidase assembly factor Coa1 family protein [Pseudoxanthomonas daejeonensis]KAF1694338.1 hypothetical protein CSC65_09100 [Pseudoxanthomonas daejeonensis]
MENTSGGGDAAVVPPEIDRWNWGAFVLTWIWGVCNNTFIALLMFVPFANMVMPFVLGARGSAWAWRNKRWESVEAFKAAQRKWAWWGLAALLLFVLLLVGIFAAVFATLKHSEPYRLTVQALEANPAAVDLLGQPISTGIPMGGIQTSGPDGEANLSFSAEGPRGEGTVYMKATKSFGQWVVDRAVLQDEETGQRLELVEGASSGPLPGVEP